MTTIDRVITMLEQAGYRQLPKPLSISNVPYDFAAGLIGGDRSLDLVIVADLILADKNEQRLVQKFQSLSRVLDLAESRRSLTAILVGGEVAPETTESIARVCRVLAVGVPPQEHAEQYLADWLAVLLPLPDFDAANTVADWKAEIEKRIGQDDQSKFIAATIAASNHGAESVERIFATQVRTEATKALRERRND